MPDGNLNFSKARSLLQSLKLNISDKFHVFPGGRVVSHNVNIRARNITIEAAGSLITKCTGISLGSGNGMFY